VTCDRSVVSSTNKTDSLDITEILLKVVRYSWEIAEMYEFPK
jgi:hypothetical protein